MLQFQIARWFMMPSVKKTRGFTASWNDREIPIADQNRTLPWVAEETERTVKGDQRRIMVRLIYG